MTLHFNTTTCPAEINKLFREKYPNLKLMFFKAEGLSKTNDISSLIRNEEEKFSVLYKNFRSAEIIASGNLQARSLELKINELTGTIVQVFHRSGKLWLETTTTDNRTLSELNKLADEFSASEEQDEKPDYQDQD